MQARAHTRTHLYTCAHTRWDVHTGAGMPIYTRTHPYTHIHMGTRALYTCTHAHTCMLTHCVHTLTHARSGSHFIGELDSGPRVFPPLSAPARMHSRGDPQSPSREATRWGRPGDRAPWSAQCWGRAHRRGPWGRGRRRRWGPGGVGQLRLQPGPPQGRWPILGSGAGVLGAGCPWGRGIRVWGPQLWGGGPHEPAAAGEGEDSLSWQRPSPREEAEPETRRGAQ